MNLIDVSRELATDEQCLAFLEKQRWPDGIVRCPTCGNDQISRITRKAKSKNLRAQVYQCLEKTCKQQFSATNGSIFHDSHLPLHKWFMAIALIVDAKKGISAKQVQKHLGIGSYKTAWYVCHRVRKANGGRKPYSDERHRSGFRYHFYVMTLATGGSLLHHMNRSRGFILSLVIPFSTLRGPVGVSLALSCFFNKLS